MFNELFSNYIYTYEYNIHNSNYFISRLIFIHYTINKFKSDSILYLHENNYIEHRHSVYSKID